MRKILLLLTVLVVVLFSVFYFVSNKEIEAPIPSQKDTTFINDISWETERVSSGSNDVPTYNLTLNIGGQSFVINDYLEESLYGCRNFGTDRPADSQAPKEAVSDQLCYFMAGGDLFYVLKDGEGYQVLHKTISDGMPEQSASLLFRI